MLFLLQKRGGPRWEVWLGRKDSLKASFDGANQFIPSPNSSLETLIANFKQQGLDTGDLVTLSGEYSNIISDQTMLTLQANKSMLQSIQSCTKLGMLQRFGLWLFAI